MSLLTASLTGGIAGLSKITSPGAGGGGAEEDYTGAIMLFYNSTAPTGWTQVTNTTFDQSTVRVVTSNTAGYGGSLNFPTVFASKTANGTVVANLAISNTTLQSSQIPLHDHTGFVTGAQRGLGPTTQRGTMVASGMNWPQGSPLTQTRQDISGNSAGGGMGHFHTYNSSAPLFNANAVFYGKTFSLNVRYIDVILAEKT